MKLQRGRNAKRNIYFGILYRIVATLSPFLLRTVLLYSLGVQYLGLNSLFTSLLSFLSLAELGVGSAMVYAMYKPVAEDDVDMICSLLALYRKLYLIIGGIIMTMGLCLMPFIDKLIKGDHPADINLYVLFSVYLLNTVISYFFFGYKRSILSAYQREDLISRNAMIIQLLMYVFQIAGLLLTRNYYVYICMLPVFTVITNLINSRVVDRLYPKIKCRGKVSAREARKIRKNVMALIGGKLSNTVLHSSDNLVLSAFTGLSMVAIYGNYFYILNAITGFTAVIYSALTAGLGNSLVSESPEKNYGDFKTLSFLNGWLVMWCCTCLMCLFQPFMKVWAGEELLFPISMVVLFVIYFYMYQINKIVLTYKDAGGLWWADRFRPYVIMGINLVFNIISVQIIGVHGVIMATIISLCVSIPWSTYTVFHKLFPGKIKEYTLRFIWNIGVSAVICGVTYYVCEMIPGGAVMQIVARFLVCCILPNGFFVLFNLHNQDLKTSLKRLRSVGK